MNMMPIEVLQQRYPGEIVIPNIFSIVFLQVSYFAEKKNNSFYKKITFLVLHLQHFLFDLNNFNLINSKMAEHWPLFRCYPAKCTR